jgi:hypothetical protein
MATFSKHILTGSTHGAAIVITGSTTDATTTGTTLHTAVAGTSSGNLQDEVFIYIQNMATNTRDVVIGFGGTGTDNFIRQPVPARDGLYQVIPGMPLRNGLKITANATANDDLLKAYGYVNRVVS